MPFLRQSFSICLNSYWMADAKWCDTEQWRQNYIIYFFVLDIFNHSALALVHHTHFFVGSVDDDGRFTISLFYSLFKNWFYFYILVYCGVFAMKSLYFGSKYSVQRVCLSVCLSVIIVYHHWNLYIFTYVSKHFDAKIQTDFVVCAPLGYSNNKRNLLVHLTASQNSILFCCEVCS